MVGGRQAIRWALRHGVIRYGARRLARRDDLLPGLMFDPVVIANPYPQYDRLRARRRLVDHGIALDTAHHDLAVAALRSPDLGVSRARAGRPRAGCGCWSGSVAAARSAPSSRHRCSRSTVPTTPATGGW
jgi:hypothetical protein